MQIGSVTTPFGRRPAKLALVRQQIHMAAPERSADKWRIFRDICAARVVSDRAATVLNALLSFYPDPELAHDGQLVVFPSNNALAARAHGMAPATLRRHLSTLVEAGIIIRNDSPNGKRYARKGKGGVIETAFGFDLTPMLARADEFALAAQAVAEELARVRRIREAVTIAKRDIRKLLEAAEGEGAEGDWGKIREIFAGLGDDLDGLQLLRTELLEMLDNRENMSANDDHSERHQHTSNPEPIYDFEPHKENSGAELKAYPLGMVLRACPEIRSYGRGGEITSWRDMMAAAVVVRSMLGVSPSAYQEACEVLGPENAATVIACILERAGHINSAGGYLRELTARAAKGEFTIGPMIMALMRKAA